MTFLLPDFSSNEFFFYCTVKLLLQAFAVRRNQCFEVGKGDEDANDRTSPASITSSIPFYNKTYRPYYHRADVHIILSHFATTADISFIKYDSIINLLPFYQAVFTHIGRNGNEIEFMIFKIQGKHGITSDTLPSNRAQVSKPNINCTVLSTANIPAYKFFHFAHYIRSIQCYHPAYMQSDRACCSLIPSFNRPTPTPGDDKRCSRLAHSPEQNRNQ